MAQRRKEASHANLRNGGEELEEQSEGVRAREKAGGRARGRATALESEAGCAPRPARRQAEFRCEEVRECEESTRAAERHRSCRAGRVHHGSALSTCRNRSQAPRTDLLNVRSLQGALLLGIVDPPEQRQTALRCMPLFRYFCSRGGLRPNILRSW